MSGPTKDDLEIIRALMRLELKRMRQEGWEAALDRADDQRRAAKEAGGK